jgi:hypothetical protein
MPNWEDYVKQDMWQQKRQRKVFKEWKNHQWRNELPKPDPTVKAVRVIVRCRCGHQAELSLKFRGVQHQPLRCSKCRNADPAIERLDIGPRQARYHPGAATGPRQR